MHRFSSSVLAIWLLVGFANNTQAIEIVVDYSYDTNDFFDTPIKREAMEAAAARFSRIVTSSLGAVSPDQWRLGFRHPGTGESIQLSSADSVDDDILVEAGADPADVYGFPGLEADEWILYAGGSDIATAGFGGTGTGTNFSDVYDDLDGPFHRGLFSNTPADSVNDIPAWGGAITFNQELNWHFDISQAAPASAIDFYSIALHEVAHVLGLSTRWNQWIEHRQGDYFEGPNALDAYNADNQTTVTQLELESSTNNHWKEDTYQSFVFPLGEPNPHGTHLDALQDLLLEPQANFTFEQRRFEVTNVDAAALVDLGWSILESTENPLDLNQDNVVDGLDVDLACQSGQELGPFLSHLGAPVGDVDLDGVVGFSDFVQLSSNFFEEGNYSAGDLDCDGSVQFGDFVILSSRFGDTAAAAAARSVPEPESSPWMGAAVLGLWIVFRRPSPGKA